MGALQEFPEYKGGHGKDRSEIGSEQVSNGELTGEEDPEPVEEQYEDVDETTKVRHVWLDKPWWVVVGVLFVGDTLGNKGPSPLEVAPPYDQVGAKDPGGGQVDEPEEHSTGGVLDGQEGQA